VKFTTIKGSMLLQPLFEFSGACVGCGETPYVKLASQLFGDRMLVANATGCSSIYGGNLPTTPWTVDAAGRGPAWSNSLFEDNAEFGLGMRIAIDKQTEYAREMACDLRDLIGEELVAELRAAARPDQQLDEKAIAEQRARVAQLREILKGIDDPRARELETVAENLVRKSVWIMAATAGPTTSATAAWITCSPRAAT
jgi:pyruvate-ferredoxin/flavodoxin oxidoreductase